jgi:hypothetical protein
MIKYFLTGVLLFSALLTTSAENKKDVDSVLASVNGSPVTLLDLMYETGREEARLAMRFSGKELYAETEKLRRRILDEIINRRLIYEDYANTPFEIPEIKQYVEKTLDSLCGDFSDGTRDGLKERAGKAGTSLEELKEKAQRKVIVDIMIGQNCEYSVYVTPKEIYEYYSKHKKDFSVPSRIDLEMIFLKKNGRYMNNMDNIIKEITESTKTGNEKIFRSLAVIHSEGPNSDEGGRLGWINTPELRPEFAEALKDAPPGTVKGPVQTEEGVYFLRVAAREDSIAGDFEKAEAEIRKKIRREHLKKAYDGYIKKLRSKAVIRYFH